MRIYTPDDRCNISGERVREARLLAGISQAAIN